MKQLQIEGKWYLPHSNVITIGTLKFNQKDGGYLETNDLLGGPMHSIHEFLPIIWGESKHKIKYSLISNTLIDFQSKNKKYEIDQILEGFQIHTKEEAIFQGWRFSCAGLLKWMGIPAFNKINNEIDCLQFEYKKPNDILFQIEGKGEGKVAFIHESKFNSVDEVIIRQDCDIEFMHPNKKLSFQDTLSLFASFYQFFTFVFQIPPEITRISVLTISKDEINQLTSKINFYFKPRPFIDFAKARFLFTYFELKSFEQVINKWCELDEKAEPVSKLLFHTYFDDFILNESGFLSQVQALETFHRRLYALPQEEMEQWQTRLNSILSMVSNEDHKKWLKERLQYSYEPTLRNRLKTLFLLVSNIAGIQELGLNSEFIQSITKSRNHYTHYEKGQETSPNILKEKQLLKSILKLRIALILVILKYLELPDIFIAQIIENGRLPNWYYVISKKN